jgi:hypothetical protein
MAAKKCLADGCLREAVSKGLCDKHYRRLRRLGDPNSQGSRHVAEGDDVARFHAKYRVDESTGCWIWVAGRMRSGRHNLPSYGKHSLSSGKSIGAHRFSYELHTGELAGDNFVCHTCDNPLCVNPNHLFLSDHKGNMADMVAKGRSFVGSGENKVGVSKLTNKQALEIQNSTLSERELGLIYGISAAAAGNIRRKRSYRCVEC